VSLASQRQPVLRVVGTSQDYVEKITWLSHALLLHDDAFYAETHHDITGVSYIVLDLNDCMDLDALSRGPGEALKEITGLEVCALTEDLTPDNNLANYLSWAQAHGRTTLYLALSAAIKIKPGCPRGPIVVADDDASIREAIRVWVRATASQADTGILPLADSQVHRIPSAELGTLTGSLEIVRARL
jgi:hypothetical protein